MWFFLLFWALSQSSKWRRGVCFSSHVVYIVLLSLWQLAEKYGKVYSLKMGPLWSVVLNGLSAVQEGLAEGDYANGRPDFAIHSDVLPELGRELYFTPSPCFYCWVWQSVRNNILLKRNCWRFLNKIFHPFWGFRSISVPWVQLLMLI